MVQFQSDQREEDRETGTYGNGLETAAKSGLFIYFILSFLEYLLLEETE